MRISGGEARGIRLRVPPGTRPAAERVRQAVFSSLAARVSGARVLDLYCGSGAYGLEALSRGAERAVLVDDDRRAVRAVGDNARAAGLEARSAIRRADAGRYLEDRARDDGPFDLVFCDPPYEARGAVAGVLDGVGGALAPGGLVVAETRWGGERPPTADGWVLEDDRRYGDTRVLVYRRPGSPEGASAGREDGKAMTKACCPGSFDPVTNGHLDIIERATGLFEEVIVAVVENPSKAPLFTISERVELLREVTSHLEGVKVASFRGLLVDFCRQQGANVIVKGLRAVTDFDYEMQQAQMNQRMGTDTAFMATNPEYSYLSSSLMREVVSLGGEIEGLLPPKVLERLREKLEERDG